MLDSFISIRCRLALYSFGVLFIFLYSIFGESEGICRRCTVDISFK